MLDIFKGPDMHDTALDNFNDIENEI